MLRRPVLGLHRRRRREAERQADARRERGRQRRAADRADGLPRSARGRDRPRTLDGFTPEQRLFLGWGQVWCENRRPERARLLAQTDPHSPGRSTASTASSRTCRSSRRRSRARPARRWCGRRSAGSGNVRRRLDAESAGPHAMISCASIASLAFRVADRGSRRHRLLRALPAPARVLRRDRADEEARATATRSTGAGRCPASAIRDARLLLVGLAPAAHGANRTGRVFTGDGPVGSGDFLMARAAPRRLRQHPDRRSIRTTG